MQLPTGVYAVSSAFQNKNKVSFFFKGQAYEAQVGKNAFYRVEDFVRAEICPAQEAFCGYVGTPILLFPAGVYEAGKEYPDTAKAERFCNYLPQAVTILGENAGISPNGEDIKSVNPLWGAESVFLGSQYFGGIGMEGTLAGTLTVDGMVFQTSRIVDDRVGGENVRLVVKNCAFRDDCTYDLVVTETLEDPNATRQTVLENIRCDGISSMEGESLLVDLRSGDLTVENMYFANTEKFPGLTDFRQSRTCGRRGEKATITYKNCLFENCTAPVGFWVTMPEESQMTLHLEDCTLDAVAVNLGGEKGRLRLKNCAIKGAVVVKGDLDKQVLAEGCQVTQKPPRRMQILQDADILLDDPHQVAAAEFAPLDQIYAGMTAFHGDAHTHTNSGGTSDGKTPLKEFLTQLKALDMDFAAVVDHRQMRHFFLPEWDETMLICGSEPSVTLQGRTASLHYNMIFPDKAGLGKVLEAFPEFEYTGGTDGSFRCPRFTEARFRELGEYIYRIGGLMAHAHPKQQMITPDPLDYYFGDHVALETVHGAVSGYATRKNRDLWVTLLKMGKKLRTYGSTDTHGAARNDGQTTLYAKNRHSKDFFNAIRAGNCTAGAVGIQMAIDSTPMGGETAFKEGMVLRLRVGDFYKTWQKNAVFRLNVYTDKGLAYATEFLGTEGTRLSLKVKKRAFYRAEITDESDGKLAALGNPIWLD